jgi:hypothetical protein
VSALNETAPPTPKEVFLVQKISLVLAMAAVIVMLFAPAALAQRAAAGGGTEVAQPAGGGGDSGGGGGGATATATASPTAAATAQYAQYATATPTALAPTGGPPLAVPFALVAGLAMVGFGVAALVFVRRGLT